ncbi:hypothetical protein P9314_12840 [Paenibacillus validus]|uniref:Uncharacterized protein n=1 Tax=Paenibacillus validus TaxID=44253 RepID=A0A7X2ZC93_9BACL|nr:MULTISPECIES: hypothetical protein [Paenibacillus]MED4601589.1 hypothetical protein [Paenibacillus validus]MED4607625.1 hypothetical protein [Paenibacillus validus]MUG71615.1 hypothetical protein [Paenibacillus validus]
MQSGDGFIVILLIVVLIFWLYKYLRGKMRETVEQVPPLEWLTEEAVPEDEATLLLGEYGYRVLSGKRRVPVYILVNDSESLQSRLFIDYMAERDGEYYAVKLAKDRKPLEKTGSAVRDRLFVYQLLDAQTAGVLYVHLQDKLIDCYRFSLTEPDEEEL